MAGCDANKGAGAELQGLREAVVIKRAQAKLAILIEQWNEKAQWHEEAAEEVDSWDKTEAVMHKLEAERLRKCAGELLHAMTIL